MALPKSEFNLKDILEIIFTRKWIFIIAFVPILIGSFLYSFTLPEFYRSACTLEVKGSTLEGKTVPEQAQMQSYVRRIKSTDFIELIIKDLGLDKNVDDYSKLINLVDGFKNRANAWVSGTSVLGVSFEDTNPKFAKDVVEVMVKTFLQEDRRAQEGEMSSTMDFIKNQLEIYQDKLQKGETALSKYKIRDLPLLTGDTVQDRVQLIQLSSDSDASMQNLIKFQFDLLDVDAQITSAEQNIDFLREKLVTEEKSIIQKSMEESPIASVLNQKLIAYETELARLLMDCTEEHPLVKSLRGRMNKTKAKLDEELKKSVYKEKVIENPAYLDLEKKIKEMQSRIFALQGKKKELENLIEIYKEKVEEPTQSDPEKVRLLRDQRLNQGVYYSLFTKLEDIKLQQQLESGAAMTKFKILDPARIPKIPTRKGRNRTIFLGFIIGMFVGAGFVYLIELSDHSFRGIDDASKVLELPILGSIPAILAGKRK